MKLCSVHRYAWGQEKRRVKLKKLLKDGVLKFKEKTKTHYWYEILDQEKYNLKKSKK